MYFRTKFHKNEQKRIEETYKDGKPDWLTTIWYKNGQKIREVIIREGKQISEKMWNEDCSVKEWLNERSNDENSYGNNMNSWVDGFVLERIS